MSSQMFWLLSYVSLGLALSLGNRPTGIHASSSSSSSSSASSSQQQKQQSASSSQALKSRQDKRLIRDDTSKNFDIGETGAASSSLVELDNIVSRYSYANENDDEDDAIDDDDDNEFLPREIVDNSNFREIRDKNVRTMRRNHVIDKNGYLDEFAIAVLDTLYPRNRLVRLDEKLSNTRKSMDYSPLIDGNYPREVTAGLEPRLRKKAIKSRTTRIEDYRKKITKTPIIIYRPDESDDDVTIKSSIALKDDKIFKERGKMILSSRLPASVDTRNSVKWSKNDDTENNDNYGNREILLPYGRQDRTTMRRDNEIDHRWVIDASTGGDGAASEKSADKRNDGGNGRKGNSRGENVGGWTENGQRRTQTPAIVSNTGASIASQFLLRSARGNRQYDVPQIECPASEDGMERFACPTPDRMGRYRCIDDHVLCDGFIDCPTAEDEDRQACMFYKTTKAHLDVLADALLRWARGR